MMILNKNTLQELQFLQRIRLSNPITQGLLGHMAYNSSPYVSSIINKYINYSKDKNIKNGKTRSDSDD